MLNPQFILPIASELVVDLFAGGGGASTGVEQAIGRHVDIAINHDPEAISLHTANHPQTRHFVSDVFEVDPLAVTDGQTIGLLWASPDCTFHSKARGGKPFRDRNKARRRRGLATVVTKWVRILKPTNQHPRVICLENVEEFQHWGPLLEDGTPCPDRRGASFQRWVAQLRNLGYVVEWRELRACDFGAPTIRKRLFLVARRDGMPIVWPEATHGKPDSLPVKQKKLKPWRTAAECIDWSVPAPSIFERSKPLADATCRRIAKGIMRYVVEADEPFIVKYHAAKRPGDERVGDLHSPLPTQTTENRFGLCVPTLVQTGYGEREGQAPRALDLGKPLGTVVAGQKHALVQAFLAKHYTGVVGSDMADPMGTVTTVDHHSLVTANLVHLGHGEGKDGKARFSHGIRDVTDPLNTITASGAAAGLVTATLESNHGCTSSFQGTDQGWASGDSAGRDHLEAGTPRQSAARDADRSEASGTEKQKRLLDGQDGMAGEALLDRRAPRRVHAADRPTPAGNGCKPFGRRQGQQQPGKPGTGDARSESPARLWDRSSGCIGGDRQGVGHSEEVRAFLIKYYSTDGDPQLREPMHTVTTKDRFGLVTIHGTEYAIVDIGLRMLTPRELYRAQGFPEAYAIDKGADGRPLTKTAQVRMCGNSVCPPLARALVSANYAEHQTMRAAA